MALHLRSDHFSLRVSNTHRVNVIVTDVRTSDLAKRNNNDNDDDDDDNNNNKILVTIIKIIGLQDNYVRLKLSRYCL
jgi:hypothetical protein